MVVVFVMARRCVCVKEVFDLIRKDGGRYEMGDGRWEAQHC